MVLFDTMKMNAVVSNLTETQLNREFLLKQILEKINLLEKKIENDKGKRGEFLWMQEEKRIEKIDLLINLVIFLLP